MHLGRTDSMSSAPAAVVSNSPDPIMFEVVRPMHSRDSFPSQLL